MPSSLVEDNMLEAVDQIVVVVRDHKQIVGQAVLNCEGTAVQEQDRQRSSSVGYSPCAR